MLSRSIRPIAKRPVSVLQIGAGNFSRAFTAFALQMLNDGGLCNAGIAVATSSPEGEKTLKNQDGLYTLTEASRDGRRHHLVDVVQEQFSIPDNFQKFLSYAADLNVNLITSNTTEVGITYKEEGCTHKVQSFPARLALWLNERHKTLAGAEGEDLFILPCELLENNGTLLRQYVLRHAEHWGLSAEFIQWMGRKVKFMNTLVDRIVPGYPDKYIAEFQGEWGYQDEFAVLSESFFFLAIEGDTAALDKAYPFSRIPLDIVYTDRLEFYRLRKVSYLNGAHTLLLGLSLLGGFPTVQDTLKDSKAAAFLRGYLDEACAALDGNAETRAYIEDVCARFANPYLAHRWGDILLNASSKFAIRNIPVMLALEKRGQSPEKGLRALAALLVLYLKGTQKDANYGEFQKILAQNGDSASLARAYLSNPIFCPPSLPVDAWAPRLGRLMDELKTSPENLFVP